MQRVATDEEITAMQELLRRCLQAGAVGLSTSFVDMDETLQPVPSRYADMREFDALASVLGEFARIFQIVPEFYDADVTIARVDQLAEISLKHGIATTFSPLFVNNDNVKSIERVMRRVDEQFARGCASLAAGPDATDRYQLQFCSAQFALHSVAQLVPCDALWQS